MLHPKRASLRRTLVLILAAMLLAALAAGCGKKEQGIPGAGTGQVIATYNGGEVTEGEFDKYTAYMEVTNQQMAMYLQIPQFKEQFVKQFALYKDFAARASDEQVKKAEDDVKDFQDQLKEAIKQYPELKDLMKEKNISNDELIRIHRLIMAGSQIWQAKHEEYSAAVTDEQLKAEYDQQASDYNIVSVRHILIGTMDPQTYEQTKTDEEALKLAEEVKEKLEQSGDWDALAKEYSDDDGSKNNGGLYEQQEARMWVPAFKEAANTQPIGQIGDPVQTEYGYHVMKVESREETPFDKLEQVDKDELREYIVNDQLEKYMAEEEERLDIKVTLPAEPSESPADSPSASPSASESE